MIFYLVLGVNGGKVYGMVCLRLKLEYAFLDDYCHLFLSAYNGLLELIIIAKYVCPQAW